MKARAAWRAILCVVLLILAVGPSLALDSPPILNLEEIAALVDSVANSPWFIKTIESTNDVGEFVSIVIDRNTGVTYISYYDSTSGDLRMATNIGSAGNCGPGNTWSCEVVDDGGTSNDDVGLFSSIAINTLTGLPAIAYYDLTNGTLKYAMLTCVPACQWLISTIDSSGSDWSSTGHYASLDFYAGGMAVIAYYEYHLLGEDYLRVAYYIQSGGNCGEGDASGKWQCDTVDGGNQVGWHPSVTTRNRGGPEQIAYYDGGNGDLKYAIYTGAGGNCGPGGDTWQCDVIDSTGDVGLYASMYKWSRGQQRIAYHDATNGKLKYARYVASGGNCGGGSWQCDEIDTTGTSILPMGISIAPDAAGYPIIAYQDIPGEFFPGMLKVARPASALGQLYGNCGPQEPFATWQCDTIDRGGDIFFEASYVAIDVNTGGLATIAYHEEDDYFNTDNLKIAYQLVRIYMPLVARN